MTDRAVPQVDAAALLAHAERLRALARSLVSDGADADDVVQQTFVAAIEHPPRPDAPPGPWLTRVARNFSFRLLRARRRRVLHEAAAAPLASPASPDEAVARTEMLREIVDAVLALEPIYRDVVIARFFDGLAWPAAATRLGVPVETARTRLKRALAMLRDRLDRKYGDRRAWAVLLFAGRRAAPTAAGVGGGIVAAKILAATAVALVVAGGWYALRTEDAPGDRSSRETPVVSTGTTAASAAPRHASSRARAATASGNVRNGTGATLIVRVTEADTRRPVADATVVLRERQLADTTDAAGTVRFEGLVARTWYVDAEAPGHLRQFVSAEAADGVATTIDLVLPRAATMEVRTVDAAGVVVPNVGFTYGILGDAGFGMCATFADGRAQLPVLPNVVMVVRVGANVSHHGRTSAAVWTGPLGAPPVTATLRVVPEARLVGVVRDADGNPDDDATVRAMPSDASSPEFDPTRGGLEATTDDEGRYAVAGLVRGRSYDVVASDSRHAQQRWAPSVVARSVFVPDGATEITRDFALRHNAQLVVRVVGSNGEIAPGACVVVERASQLVIAQPETPGVFVWKSIESGTVCLVAMATGEPPCRRIVDVPADETTRVTIDVGRTAPTIAGVVVDETGGPVACARISARVAASFTGKPVADLATSDDAGRFRGSALGDGPLVLDAAAPGHLPLHGLELPAPSEEVRIVMRRAAIVTFGLTADADAPRIGTIRLLFAGSTHADTVYTSDVGAVRLEKYPRGETEMRLYVERFAPVVRRVKLTAGGVDDLGEIRLVAAAPLRGRVVDAADRPVANASVWLDMGDDDLKLDAVRTDADGAFTAQLAPPSGPVPLRVDAPGFLTLRSTVAVDGDAAVTLRPTRGGVVWGEVVDASGAPVPCASVSVLGPEGAKSARDADECGLFGARVAAGRCTVSVAGTTTTADVIDGGETHVRVVVAGR
jgi:RNA polymerase sigma-70 factor (ECF subfamily)